MSDGLKRDYEAARTARKAIERELDQLPKQIEAATRAGNAPELIRLRQRQIEAPAHYAAASRAEEEARKAWIIPAKTAEQERRDAIGRELEEIKLSRVKAEADYKAELARLEAAEKETQERFHSAQSKAASLVEVMVKGSAGYQAAVNRIVSV